MTAPALILSLVLWTSPATEGGSPYEVDPVIDGTATAAAFVFSAVLAGLVKPTLPASRNCDLDPATGLCDAESLSALDRGVVGMKSAQWRLVSDVSAWFTYAAPIGLGALDYFHLSDHGTWGDLGADLLVTAQAVGLTVLVTDLFKFAVGRPRPTQYTEGVFSGALSTPWVFRRGTLPPPQRRPLPRPPPSRCATPSLRGAMESTRRGRPSRGSRLGPALGEACIFTRMCSRGRRWGRPWAWWCLVCTDGWRAWRWRSRRGMEEERLR